MKQQPKPQNWPMTGIGRERRAHLEARVQACVRSRWQIRDKADPPAVAKARKLVTEHDEKKNKRADALYEAMTNAAREVDSQILFAPDADAALKAVERFEALAKRKGWTRGA